MKQLLKMSAAPATALFATKAAPWNPPLTRSPAWGIKRPNHG